MQFFAASTYAANVQPHLSFHPNANPLRFSAGRANSTLQLLAPSVASRSVARASTLSPPRCHRPPLVNSEEPSRVFQRPRITRCQNASCRRLVKVYANRHSKRLQPARIQPVRSNVISEYEKLVCPTSLRSLTPFHSTPTPTPSQVIGTPSRVPLHPTPFRFR